MMIKTVNKMPLSLPYRIALFLIFLQISLFSCLQAQPIIDWDKTYGGLNYEECQALLKTNDSYLMAGMTNSSESGDVGSLGDGSIDFWLIEIDTAQNGALLNEWRYGCDGTERAWDIIPAHDGGYILSGYSDSDACAMKAENSRNGSRDFWVMKIDTEGNQIWERTIGGGDKDVVRKTLATSDGGYLIGGYSHSNAGFEKSEDARGLEDFWVVKLDINGTIQWDKTYGGDGQEHLLDMLELTNGEYLLGGFSTSDISGEKTSNARGFNDYWIIRIQLDGTVIQDYTYGGNSRDVIQYMHQTRDGGILLTGQSESEANPNFGEKNTPHYGRDDYWIVKLDANFDIVWERTYGGDDIDIPFAVYENLAGRLWIIGVSHSGQTGNKSTAPIGDTTDPSENDFWLLFLQEDGTEIWQENIGGNDIEAPIHLEPAHGGGYIIAGHSSSNAGGWKSEDAVGLNDFWVIKTDCLLKNHDLEHEIQTCEETPIDLDLSVVNCDACFYDWADGSNDTIRTFFLAEDTTFDLIITHEDGCEKLGNYVVEVIGKPEVTGLEILPPICFDDSNGEVWVEGIENGTPPYQVALNGENPITGQQFQNLPAGEYHIAVIDSLGCETDTMVQLPNPPPLQVDLGPNRVIEFGDSVWVNPIATEAIAAYEWKSTGLPVCDTCLAQWLRPADITTYDLTVFNENGCSESDFMTIKVVRDALFYAPNIFSPNLDGINDRFQIYAGFGVTNIKTFQVFDRWGNQVFATENILPQEQYRGWDGNANGRRAAEAVYTWYAEIEFFDGTSEVAFGDVALVR